MKAGAWIAGPLPCPPRAVRRTDVRYLSGVLTLSLLMAGACANRSTATTVSSGATPASAGATSGAAVSAAPGGRGAGPQAAARMTPEQLDAAMRTISATNAALGRKLMNNDLPGAAKDAQT